MRIGIVGTGSMATGFARALAGKHEIVLGSRDPEKANTVASEVGARRGGSYADAVREGDVVILAVPWMAIDETIPQLGDLGGKVVIDITNPVDTQTWDRLATAPGSSSAEEVAALVPDGTPVVKAFNTTFAPTLADGEVSGQPLDVFIAGDDADAKATISRLVEAGGLRAIDAGPLQRARQLEALGLLHMALQFTLNTGFQTAVKLLTP